MGKPTAKPNRASADAPADSSAIRVYCDCGRKLSVSADQAGRKTVCPVCGMSVAVPRRGRKKPPAAPVMTERFVEGTEPSQGAPASPVEAQVHFGSHQPGPPTPPKRRRPPRTQWWESLFVPLDSWRFLLGFGVVGAIAMSFFAAILQRELTQGGATAAWRLLGAVLVTALPAVGLIGAFFSHVVADPARVRKIRADRHWALLSFEQATTAFVRCVCCLCCGPILAVLVAGWYWVRRGDAEWLDRIVLAEIFGIGGGWLALQILLTSSRPWSGMLPLPVARAAWKLGWKAAVVATGFALLLATLAPRWHTAMTANSRGSYWTAFRSWLVVFAIGLSVGGILMRLLGGWYARIGEPLVEPEVDAPTRAEQFPIPIPEAVPDESSLAVQGTRGQRSASVAALEAAGSR